MYDSRWMNLGVLVMWLASITWLVATKIVPLMRSGQPPQQTLSIPDEPGTQSVVDWTISWNGRPIGTATSRGIRRVDQSSLVTSVVALDDLPVSELARDVLGPLATMLPWDGRGRRNGRRDMVVDVQVETEMEFDAFGHLERLRSEVDAMGMPNILQLTGEVARDGLLLRATMPAGEGQSADYAGRTELFSQQIDVPADALVVDALSPSPRLDDLQLGQEWTYRAVRPFPPSNPWQIVRARVTHTDELVLQGNLEEVLVVTFTDSSATSLTAAEAPFSTLWVRSDGTVVRQQLAWGRLVLVFDRNGRPDRK